MTTSRTFFAAKINIHGNIFSPDLQELIDIHIPRVIKDSKPIKSGNWNWSFTDIEEIPIEDSKTVIIGNVTKSKQATQKVRQGSRTVKKKSDDEIAHTAFFVYDPSNEILAHETTGYINTPEFIRLFTRLLSEDSLVGEVKIIPIPEPQTIRKEFLTMDKITSVKFHIIHPNPGEDEFNLYQKLIDETNSKEVDINLENKDGLNIQKVELNNGNDGIEFKDTIEHGIKLIEAGYGDVEIKGADEVVVENKNKKKVVQKKKTYTSRKSTRKISLNEYDKEKLVTKVYNFIYKVKRKIKNEGENLEN